MMRYGDRSAVHIHTRLLIYMYAGITFLASPVVVALCIRGVRESGARPGVRVRERGRERQREIVTERMRDGERERAMVREGEGAREGEWERGRER